MLTSSPEGALSRPTLEEVEEKDGFLNFMLENDVISVCACGMLAGCGWLAVLIMGISLPFSPGLALGLNLLGTLLITLLFTYFCAMGISNDNQGKLCDRLVVQPRLQRRLARRERAYRRALSQLDRLEGWRPREGAPHPAGRDDTHDRYRVQAEADEQSITLRIVRWIFQEGEWTSAPKRSYGYYFTAPYHPHQLGEPESFADHDEEGIQAARARMERLCAQQEGRSVVEHAESEAEAEIRRERLALNQRAVELINNSPSL